MKHVKKATLTLLAILVLAIPVSAIGDEPSPEPNPTAQAPAQTQQPVQQQAPSTSGQQQGEADQNRVQACEKRQASIQTKTAKYVENANKYQAVVDTLYERVQSFYNSGQLTIGNYEELAGLVEAAKTQVQTRTQTLSGMNGSVDCANPDGAVHNVRTFRTGAGDAKDALRNYSTSVKNLISAMQGDSSEGGL